MIKKLITFILFAVASLLVVLAFVTAKSYIQLMAASVFYPLLMYLIYRFMLKTDYDESGYSHIMNTPQVAIGANYIAPATSVPNADSTPNTPVEQAKVEVADIDKRTFLKVVGAAGLSFFVFSLLGRRIESLLFGNAFNTGLIPTPTPGIETGQTKSLSTEGYIITEIDDARAGTSFYGFVNNKGEWFVMKEDSETSSYRYAKGEQDFSAHWQNRENLDYDYYFNLF
jgi:hypothetical protein